ncbi:MAG TPA: PhoPQ-activated pathogenicity-related family protein [Gemmataceae bacterium]|nr:PhoPQ-activated pathogenicity-related family protein [Gemmataceae bacterium]
MKRLHAAFVLCALALPAAADPPAKKTPLDDYLARPDPTYAWKLVKTTPGDGVTSYVLDLKSQSWRSPPEVDRPVWQHWLTIARPDKVTADTALLVIGGGRNGGEAPAAAPADAADRARRTGTVVVSLGQVPNQPLVFNKDGQGRSEDDLLAYCHIRFLETGDPTWVARLPMVKSAVKAMDAATEFLASADGGKVAVKHFVVTGGSKRGWTTWLTGAVDPRVKAIVPVVIDVLNVRPSMMNHYAAYGFWAPAVGNYAVQHKVMDRWDSPRMAELNAIEDPYSYLDRLTLPKYVVNAAGDQFFTPDSSKFYFDDLKGPKYLRYVPNGDHSLRGTDAADSVLAFYRAIVTGAPLPKFGWTMGKDGSITVTTETKPREVNLWQATNPKARDFRLMTIGKAYRSSPLRPDEKGVYVGRVAKPEAGWTAFFVELVFDSGDEKAPYKFTTQVQVVPDVLPHSFDEFRKTLK